MQRTDANGRTRWHTETDTSTVVDFDFYVDASQHIAAGPVHWTIPDNEPAYRGKMYEEVDAPAPLDLDLSPSQLSAEIELGTQAERVRRKATRQEKKSVKAWNHERTARGLPPWVGPETGWGAGRPSDALVHQTNVLKSSKTVRQWADEYCASHKMLKEFTYEKVRAYSVLLYVADSILTNAHTIRSSTVGTVPRSRPRSSPPYSRHFTTATSP